jgi:hypothetical protein
MRIAQVIQSSSWGEISPEAFDRGIGGREGAFVRLAKEWASSGHDVTCFVHTNKAKRFKEGGLRYKDEVVGETGFHEYIPISLAQPMLASFPYDAVVAWECPSVFGMDEILEKQNVRLVHMQVAHLSDAEMVAANQYATGVVALSEWAKKFLVHSGLENPNLYVRPNGVNIEDYPFKEAMKSRRNPAFVYSSSPDRGLWHLLKMWPEIMKYNKRSRLFVAYGVNR